MKKALGYKLFPLAAAVCVAFACITPGAVYAVGILPEKVRVGLTTKYDNTLTAPLGNKTVLLGYGQGDVFVPWGGLTAQTGFTMAVSGQFFVSLPTTYDTWDKALAAAAQQSGIPAAVAANAWMVYIGGYNTQGEAQTAAASVGGKVAAVGSTRVVLMDGSQAAAVFEGVPFVQVADAAGDFVSVGDRKYRGVVEFGRYDGRGITPVNIVSVDEYLYSVVPSEMPSAWPLEALKAQAVAARNYTVTDMGKHNGQGFQFCDGPHCQTYLGVTNEAASTTQAVNETSGVLAYYNGQPINAVYFSSSGGYTEDSGNVWVNASPYLKSVPEVNETQYKEWVRSFTPAEIQTQLAAKGIQIGTVTGVSVKSVSAAGRVMELTINGTSSSATLVKEEIRNFFAGTTGGILESRNFTLSNGSAKTVATKVSVWSGGAPAEMALNTLAGIAADGQPVALNNATVTGSQTTFTYTGQTNQAVAGGNAIVFSGRGYGHGVGMSQYGAKGMAEIGYTFDQILKHYYSGIEVQ